MLNTYQICKACLAFLIGFLLVISFSVSRPRAHDPLHQRADLNDWFNNLYSQGKPNGSGEGKHRCCSNQDGASVKDAEWRSSKGHYEVMIADKWFVVPDEAVVTAPNRYGPAMVWGSFQWVGSQQEYVFRCFMPGTMI